MASYNWDVYKYNGTSWVELTNVQSISFRYGQQQLTDQWSPPIWTISGRLPNDLGTVSIGDYVSVINSGSPEFIYQVTNYEVFYGITPSMDTWTMQVESGFSALGRSLSTTDWTADAYSAGASAFDVCDSIGIGLNGTDLGLPFGGPVSPQSIVNENGLEVFTRLARTATVDAFGYTTPYYKVYTYNSSYLDKRQTMFWVDPAESPDTMWEFTDETPTSTQGVYDSLNFGSVNLNYATKVVVTRVGGTAQTVGTGSNAFESTTYSTSDANAKLVADRFFGLLSASTSVPLSISYTKEQQSDTAVLPNQIAYLNGNDYLKITFRGTTFYASIIGQQLSSTPGSTRVTLNLCATENYGFFTLDDVVLGVLDQNRLGI
jgi:hypothetical protein